MPSNSPPSAERGASLIELMTVVVVLGILAAIAIPSFKEMTANQRLKAGANNLVATLHFARSEAIKRNSNVFVIADAAGWAGGWIVTTDNTNAYADCTATAAPASCLRVQPPLANIAATLNDAALTTITYQRDGRFTAATALPEITFCIPQATKRIITIGLVGTPKTTVQGNCP